VLAWGRENKLVERSMDQPFVVENRALYRIHLEPGYR
jgi:hypothetical protein